MPSASLFTITLWTLSENISENGRALCGKTGAQKNQLPEITNPCPGCKGSNANWPQGHCSGSQHQSKRRGECDARDPGWISALMSPSPQGAAYSLKNAALATHTHTHHSTLDENHPPASSKELQRKELSIMGFAPHPQKRQQEVSNGFHYWDHAFMLFLTAAHLGPREFPDPAPGL